MSLAEDIKTWVSENDFAQKEYFNWEDLQGSMNLEEVYNEIADQSRWMTYHEVVVKRGDEYARYYWGRGSTEMQENESVVDSLYSLVDVVPQEKTITVYVNAKKD